MVRIAFTSTYDIKLRKKMSAVKISKANIYINEVTVRTYALRWLSIVRVLKPSHRTYRSNNKNTSLK